MEIERAIQEIRAKAGLTQEGLARMLGVSFVSVNRWERGASSPSPAQTQKIMQLHASSVAGAPFADLDGAAYTHAFASRGVRHRSAELPLFDEERPSLTLSDLPLAPILERISTGKWFGNAEADLTEMLSAHSSPAPTASEPPAGGMSAGKNTYTYDAHTYHTKVPPQGIAELLRHYLPNGGLVVDPFAGSGMTGVAAMANGYDCLLNELAPAACFIANRFTRSIAPRLFAAGVEKVLDELKDIRRVLYTTKCRECGRDTELLYMVWSYQVICSHCDREFLLWDACRSYGTRVKEHKIRTEFPCPSCGKMLVKSRVKRTICVPVQVGYKCCGSRQQEAMHAPDRRDLETVYSFELSPPVAESFVPMDELPDGVNLNQPKRHGLDRIDRFYTPRNLAAMSHLWRTIHRVEDAELAAHLAFVFTSLYQRVTRLSEFRFWGGSGNTAHFNVPYISNESNVFVTFARKARTIQDHLETTAAGYTGRAAIVQNTATNLDYLPDASVDFIFTDPPFGANINYSEMNFLWESWLGRFTDATHEAIVNRVQNKSVADYERLMVQSLSECYRVLRPGHWMLVVFMNTNAKVWEAIRTAIRQAGFDLKAADIFDKQHGTFKQFVSENAAGFDIVFHCQKPLVRCAAETPVPKSATESINDFLSSVDFDRAIATYLHVNRGDEVDFKLLYSEWIANTALDVTRAIDFPQFRSIVQQWIKARNVAD